MRRSGWDIAFLAAQDHRLAVVLCRLAWHRALLWGLRCAMRVWVTLNPCGVGQHIPCWAVMFPAAVLAWPVFLCTAPARTARWGAAA